MSEWGPEVRRRLAAAYPAAREIQPDGSPDIEMTLIRVSDLAAVLAHIDAQAERIKVVEGALRPFELVYALNCPLDGRPEYPAEDDASKYVPRTAHRWGDYIRAARALGEPSDAG